MSTSLELLAPAGNAEIGMAAIDHGADAVYIGAPSFSARANAGQTISEISKLIEYAHLYHARVYVALNTILMDQEIPQALNIIRSLKSINTDGLIIQDLGLLELDLPSIPLIASTQMNNVSPEKVEFLEQVGFKKVVLARELSLDEIKAIRDRTTVELEVFVHGALCVSYSGQCYMSHFSCGRSANRGSCAQPCRHSYTLKDGDNKTIIQNKHLLSLKDMNRLDSIADLIKAGVTSFKIEGRYKDIDYVKNVTAAYRLALDRYLANNQNYRRQSSGLCTFSFRPEPEKTFNRGNTPYYLHDVREKPASMNTPKAIGEFIGEIEVMGQDSFILRNRNHDLQNGDGLCFFTSRETLAGCRINQVKEGRVYPNSMKDLAVGSSIYRNFDSAFSRLLLQSSHCRNIDISMAFRQDNQGICLKIIDEDGVTVEYRREIEFEAARDQDRTRAAIEKQLSKTGETPYRVVAVTIQPQLSGFLPLSTLNDIRREALKMLSQARMEHYPLQSVETTANTFPYPETELDYLANVSNVYAEQFYHRHAAQIKEKAWETSTDSPDNAGDQKTVMTTRYCLLNQLGSCLKLDPVKRKYNIKPPLKIFDKGHTYRLEFECGKCQMQIIPEDGTLLRSDK